LNIKLCENYSVIELPPSKSLNSRNLILEITANLQPDAVHTMAGPSYISFPVFHIQGISNAYITHAGIKNYFNNKNILLNFLHFLKAIYQIYKSREADFFSD